MDTLKVCFVEALGISESVVTEDLAYSAIPEWDSTGHMALVTEIESKFQIMMDTEDILDLSSVAKARSILAKHGVAV